MSRGGLNNLESGNQESGIQAEDGRPMTDYRRRIIEDGRPRTDDG